MERTCLLRACTNQQLAGPKEGREREMGGGGGGGAVLAQEMEHDQAANSPGWHLLSFQDG